MRYLNHLYAVMCKGYDARIAGLPCVAPYKGFQGFNAVRNRAWVDGWKCADKNKEVLGDRTPAKPSPF